MIKSICQNPTIAAIVGAVTVVLLGLLLAIPVVKSQVSDVRDELTQLSNKVSEMDKSMAAVTGYFKAKYPSVNFNELANVLAKKNLPNDAFYKVLSMIDIENDINKSRQYLINEMGFKPDEAKLVLPSAKLPSPKK